MLLTNLPTLSSPYSAGSFDVNESLGFSLEMCSVDVVPSGPKDS